VSKPTFNDVADSRRKSADSRPKSAVARPSSGEIQLWNHDVANSGF